MQIAEDQKKQFIVLCCLVGLVVAFGVYRLVGVGTRAGTRQAQLAVTDLPADSSDPNEMQGDTEVDGSELVNAAVQTARDPFAPQVGPAETKGMSSPNAPGPRLPPLMASAETPPFGPLVPPMALGEGSGLPTSPSARAATDPAQALKLTGVVRGTVNVAIVRGPENVRYIVKEGQKIGGKYRVESVSRSGIWVRFESKKYFLRLGGNNATQHGAPA